MLHLHEKSQKNFNALICHKNFKKLILGSYSKSTSTRFFQKNSLQLVLSIYATVI